MNEVKYNQSLIIIPWYMELSDGIKVLKEYSNAYCYYLGHRLNSNTTEDEAYHIVYGMSKIERSKICGRHGSIEYLEFNKQERIKLLFDVIKPESKEEWLNTLNNNPNIFSVDNAGLELILALAAGATFEDVYKMLKYYGDSGFATTWYIEYIQTLSQRGNDFINYLSQANKYDINKSKTKIRK